MIEIALCVNEIENKLIDEMKSILSKTILKIDGILTGLKLKEQEYFLLAFDEKHEIVIRSAIFKCVCLVVNLQFKYEFIKKHLKFETKDNVNYQALLKSFCCFDKESDEQEIKETLHFDTSLNIKSFYWFKLASLRKKWFELVDITNQNNGYLNFSDNFFEIVRFVIDGMRHEKNCVEIEKVDDKLKVHDENNLILTLEQNDIAGLVTFLIGVNPRKIITKKCEQTLIEYLLMIFNQRVEII